MLGIDDIKIAKRIRKEMHDIEAFAEDIRQNGLINPITVMPADSGEYQLLAGLRRLKAARLLGWAEIEVTVLSPADAEAALLIEINENKQREPFTLTETVEYGELLEKIAKEKARRRMTAGKKIEADDPVENFPQGQKSRDIVGEQLDMSGKQYEKAKYVAGNASPEMLKQVDGGEKSIHAAYTELKKRSGSNGERDVTSSDTETEQPPKSHQIGKNIIDTPYMQKINQQEEERIRKLQEWNALPPGEKIAALEKRVDEERTRANAAEHELARFKEQTHNQIFHRDSIIENLENQITELKIALEAAKARISEL